MWLEASSCCHPDLEVLNTIVDISSLDYDSGTPLMMSVLIKACSGCNVTVGPTDTVCSLRVVDPDCEQALTDFRIARLSSESISVSATGPEEGSARIATSRYRTATRAEDQARLSPALEAEIKLRKEQLSMPPYRSEQRRIQGTHMCESGGREPLPLRTHASVV